MSIREHIKPAVRDMPPSGIRKYFDLLNEMKDAISLGIGEPDFVTPWNIREAGIYSLEKGHTHYTSNAGIYALRTEISRYVHRKYGLHYTPDMEILVTVGGSEAIDLALRSYAGPGDEVIIPQPCFVAYPACTAFTGARPVIVSLKSDNSFKLTPDLLESALTPSTRVLILQYPNNPTGGIMERHDLEGIVEILRKREDILIISDEIYAELTYGGKKHVSIASFEGMKERTLLVSGFSKAFAMTGWRLGYACGNQDLIGSMFKIHQYGIMSAPTTAQYAAITALREGDPDVAAMVEEYDRRRRIMVDGFRKAGLPCFEPEGAFYVFPSVRETGLTSEAFCDQLLTEEKVLAVPGTAFGDCGEGFIRATYANSMDNIVEAMKRIQAFAERKRNSKQ
ncbi:MAG TPA: pyridoxal phosphate-dependent aminotransferase [Clostridiales bacterium]|nr:pyridoxal phosphate-dependent aminotransferase [Clostridiales bacterium]